MEKAARLIVFGKIHLSNLWGIVWLWGPLYALVWWWQNYPPIFQEGTYRGALNWPLFCVYFLACIMQFFRLLWAWLRS